MQIETLRIFCDLAKTGSFSQAAEKNFITQSAVSQQVRGLEEKFKRQLLERVRGRREIRLTEAGEVFYEESRQVLAAYARLEERLRNFTGAISGAVRRARACHMDGSVLRSGARDRSYSPGGLRRSSWSGRACHACIIG